MGRHADGFDPDTGEFNMREPRRYAWLWAVLATVAVAGLGWWVLTPGGDSAVPEVSTVTITPEPQTVELATTHTFRPSPRPAKTRTVPGPTQTRYVPGPVRTRLVPAPTRTITSPGPTRTVRVTRSATVTKTATATATATEMVTEEAPSGEEGERP